MSDLSDENYEDYEDYEDFEDFENYDNQEKRYKLKEQIKKKNSKNVKPNETMDETISRLEKGIKEKFLAEFKFKNEEECSSGSYSADYFTKKPQILKVINKYPDIKKMMSKGYQKKDKKEICKEIYKL